jgi:DNA-binding response OmpR family regulator
MQRLENVRDLRQMATANRGNGRSVLIVDDDEAVIESFTQTLRLDGYEVTSASNADVALAKALGSNPDVVVLDLRMPLVDAIAFLRRLRAANSQSHTRVAIISGAYSVDNASVEEVNALGAEIFLKPVWIEELIDITRQLLLTDLMRQSDP